MNYASLHVAGEEHRATAKVLPMVRELKNLRLANEAQLSAAAGAEGKSKRPNSKHPARTKVK